MDAARTELPSASLAGRVASGDERALARAATIVERGGAGARELMRELFPNTGRAVVYGITGAPGAGKSTLVNAMARLLRGRGKRVGIIAVDPSSPFSGGAILGDRIRMQSHHGDEGVFIRSMATRGWMGGLARATAEMALLMDASGREAVLIETVGVGQDEVEIARLADVTIVVMAPGMGDDVQAMKAGVMEIADVFAINKADLEGAEKLEREIGASLSLAMREDGWLPPVVKTVASQGQGVEEVLEAAARYGERRQGRERAERVWAERLRAMLGERVLEGFPAEEFRRAAAEVAARSTDPYTVVEGWMKEMGRGRA